MKTLSDYLRAFIANAEVPMSGECARSLRMGAKLIKHHIVEIEAALDCGMESHELLALVNRFLKPNKQISLSHLRNCRYRARKEFADIEARKAHVIKEVRAGVTMVNELSATTSSQLSSAILNDNECERSEVEEVTSDAASEKEGSGGEKPKITTPADLRNFRKNSNVDFNF